jgi:micrococcal nuclease
MFAILRSATGNVSPVGRQAKLARLNGVRNVMLRSATVFVAMTAVLGLCVAHSVEHIVCGSTRGHHDGDTLACVPSDTAISPFVIRVAGIDAPETGQAHWREARDLLRAMTRTGALVDCYKFDRYGRRVCRVRTADGRPLSDALVGEGLAWYDEAHSKEDSESDRDRLRALELDAKGAKRGLWGEPNPMPPKTCRAMKLQRRRCI